MENVSGHSVGIEAKLGSCSAEVQTLDFSPSLLIDSLSVVAPRRRGKTLARRKYQQGYVFQRGRKKTDYWLPKEPAYVQFWEDVPGQSVRRRKDLAVGVFKTRIKAERAAAEKLEKLRINSTQTFIESTSTITLQDQGEIWLKALANRKRNPLEQTTIDTRRYALEKWGLPVF